MSGFKPLKPQNVDAGKIEITPLKKLDNGANVAYLNYEGKPIYITTPDLDVPFDAQWWPNDDNNGKWSLKVNLRKGECDPLIGLLQNMDSNLKEKAMENSVAWFKKRNMSADTVDTLYTPMLKEDIDPDSGEPTGKYPPSMAFKIVKRDGKVQCDCYDADKKEVPLEGDDAVDLSTMFKKGTKVKMILKCNGLWIASGKFGCTWRAEQIKINSPIEYSGYAFDDDEDEGAELTRTESNMNGDKPDNFVESEEEADEDEDDDSAEESEESEEEVEEEPEPVKKKVLKKKKKVTK